MNKRPVVFVTGASGNLGQAVGEAFLKREASLVLVDRSLDRLHKNFPDLVESPDHLLAGDTNVADSKSVAEAVERAIERFGSIDALVNTVGGFRGGKRVDQEDDATWKFLFEVNLQTTLTACREIIPHLIRQGSGRIVNVASQAAVSGSAGYAAYSASKSAVVRLTESMASELNEFGINVNCVLPGVIDTPQNRAAMPTADYSNWVAPSAIADVIAFLISAESRAVTGVSIPITAGRQKS